MFFIRALLLFILSVIYLILLPLFIILPRPIYYFFVKKCMYLSGLFITGVKIKIEGRISKHHPTLFVSNHLSYLDIPVLGSLLSARFASKDDVRSWPLIGWIASLTRTLFVSRKITATRGNIDTLRAAIRNKDSVILFPEGTTTLGIKPAKFRSSFFRSVEEMRNKPYIQPITIKYESMYGIKLSYNQRDLVCWVGDADFVPHLANILKIGNISARIIFHPVIKNTNNLSRKEIAKLCEESTNSGIT